jgi:hypothetical protein
VSQCLGQVPAGTIMCRDHWTLVPKDLKTTIWDELAKSQRNRHFTSLYRFAYRQAVQMAAGNVWSPMKES